MSDFKVKLPWPVTDLPDIEIYWAGDDGMEETDFNASAALAALLADRQLIINGFLENAAEESWDIAVNCSDVFAWGCADCEELPFSELENCYRMWRDGEANGYDGLMAWCMIRRKELPQKPVLKNFGCVMLALAEKHGLRANRYDGISGVFYDCKYLAYCKATVEPKAKDGGEWYKEYVALYNGGKIDQASYDADCSNASKSWRLANGYGE